MDNQSIFNPIY